MYLSFDGLGFQIEIGDYSVFGFYLIRPYWHWRLSHCDFMTDNRRILSWFLAIPFLQADLMLLRNEKP